MGYKELTQQEYDQFSTAHKNLLLSSNEDTSNNELYDKMERDIEFLGMTAVEDQLQPELGETLDFIKQSGVGVWVFTGDRIETTRATAFAAELINEKTKQLYIDTTNEADIFKFIEENYKNLVLQSQGKQNQTSSSQSIDSVLIVSGVTLTVLHNHTQYLMKLMQIGKQCKCVLACRVSPKQKGELLKAFKQINRKDSVLAIGDGANDVTMITLADVGVGIRGTEGSQAARASDFAIGEFKNIKPLLYIHGRENYRRNSMLIIYTQWKNLIIRIASIYSIQYNLFSGQPNFNAYAGLSITVFCIFDREYSIEVLLSDPSKYQIGIKNRYFSAKVFGGYLAQAFIQGLWQFIFLVLPLEMASNREDGRMPMFWTIGDACFWVSTMIMNFNVFIYASQINVALILATIIQMIIFFATWIFISFSSYPHHNSIQDSFSSANIWFGVILSLLMAMLPEMILSRYNQLKKKQKKSKIQDGQILKIETKENESPGREN